MASSIVPLPTGKSKVWQYFGFKTDEKGIILNKKEVLCQKYEQKLGKYNKLNLPFKTLP